MRIALYGGTFDPIHNGHINLAIEMSNAQYLDAVWFIPNHISPTKTDRPPIDANHRLEMVNRAIAPLPQFRALDVEIKRGGASYTIETITELVEEEHDYFLLMADKVLPELTQWKGIEEIITKIPLLIGGREWVATGSKALDEVAIKAFTKIPTLEIDATRIRARLKENRYCGHLLPSEVLSYITENQLYR